MILPTKTPKWRRGQCWISRNPTASKWRVFLERWGCRFGWVEGRDLGTRDLLSGVKSPSLCSE